MIIATQVPMTAMRSGENVSSAYRSTSSSGFWPPKMNSLSASEVVRTRIPSSSRSRACLNEQPGRAVEDGNIGFQVTGGVECSNNRTGTGVHVFHGDQLSPGFYRQDNRAFPCDPDCVVPAFFKRGADCVNLPFECLVQVGARVGIPADPDHVDGLGPCRSHRQSGQRRSLRRPHRPLPPAR